MKSTKKITQIKLAATLGISRQLVAHHQRSGNAPELSDTAGWIEFLAVHGGRQGSLPKDIREKIGKERLRLVRAQAEKVELENQVKRGETIEFVLVTRMIRQVVTCTFFSELERLCAEFPSGLKGQNETQIAERCNAEVQKIKQTLMAQLDNWTNTKGKS